MLINNPNTVKECKQMGKKQLRVDRSVLHKTMIKEEISVCKYYILHTKYLEERYKNKHKIVISDICNKSKIIFKFLTNLKSNFLCLHYM